MIRPYRVGMQLIPIPDASGRPTIWVNAEHLVSVMPVFRTGDRDITADVEFKIEGMPLYRVRLGEFSERAAAEEAFTVFLEQLQGE